MQCRVPECEVDAMYCKACCDSCYCIHHRDKCTKKICKWCGGWSTRDHCESCEALAKGCLSRGCEMHNATRVDCCGLYYCIEHIPFLQWKKCCPACTTKGLRCIVCVKTKACPCGYKQCTTCHEFLHKDNLDAQGECNICYRLQFAYHE
jgi:hypothetical protein